MDTAALLVGLRSRLVGSYDTESVELALLDADVDAAVEKAQKRIRWEAWDGQSPINGVPASEIRVRDDVEGAYLIYIDEKLVYFQPHLPGSNVAMTPEKVQQIASAQVDRLVETTAGESLFVEMSARAKRIADRKAELSNTTVSTPTVPVLDRLKDQS